MDDGSQIGAVEPSRALNRGHQSVPRWLVVFSRDGGELRMAAIATAVCLVSVSLLIRPELVAAQPSMVTGTAAIVMFLTLWMTKVVPDFVAAALFFTILAVVGDVPEAKIFAGFLSPAVWLVFGGLIMGVAIKKSGVGNRIAVAFLERVGHSYVTLIAGIVCVCVVLTFVVPSAAARVMLLVPLVMAMAERAGFAKGSNGHDGMVAAACLGTFLPSFGVLTGTITSMTMFGAARDLYGITFSFAGYMLANFTVLSLLMAIILVCLICILFPARALPVSDTEDRTSLGRDEKMMVAILSATLLLWLTDGIHGISPAWIGLAAGIACLAPRIGPARGTAISDGVNFGVWFMLAAFISMSAVMKHSGIGEVLGILVVDILGLEAGNDFLNYLGIVGINHVVNIGATQMGSPAIMAVLSQPIAEATGWPLEGIFLAQATAWSMPLLPYEIPMMAIALGMGGVSMGRATRLLLAVAATGVVIVLPLQFLWLEFLGIIP